MLSPSDSRARLVAVALPGGVWLDEQDSAPRRVLALRSLSTTEELSCIDDRRSPAERATELLTRCVTGGDAIVPALTVGDREAALLHLRRLTFGEGLEAVVTCASPARRPGCAGCHCLARRMAFSASIQSLAPMRSSA